MNKKEQMEQAAREYPGAAVNMADQEKDTIKLEKERTCTLNNNPRNTDMKMP